ncbi:MAG: class I SAM-dependent methyltransferase [Mariniblastus sp.]
MPKRKFDYIPQLPEDSTTLTEPKKLGRIANAEVILQFVSLAGKRVLDVGCGNLGFTRELAKQGASVLAIDPDSVQAQLNREAGPIDGIEFVEAGADQIPAEHDSLDGVFFAYSLHHVPSEIYPRMFEDIFRVLKPGGFLYVIEPTDCPLNDVMRHFHNEDVERAAAQSALRNLAMPRFETCEMVTYFSWTIYESFEDYAQKFASKSFNELYTEADIRQPIVKETFERLGAPDYRFEAHKDVMVLKGLKPA